MAKKLIVINKRNCNHLRRDFIIELEKAIRSKENRKVFSTGEVREMLKLQIPSKAENRKNNYGGHEG